MSEPAKGPAVDLSAIRRRSEAATPGPWSQGMIGDELIQEVDYGAAFALVKVDRELSDDGQFGIADATFIAHAPTDIATLLAALATAEAKLARAENVVEAAQDEHGKHQKPRAPRAEAEYYAAHCATCIALNAYHAEQPNAAAPTEGESE